MGDSSPVSIRCSLSGWQDARRAQSKVKIIRLLLIPIMDGEKERKDAQSGKTFIQLRGLSAKTGDLEWGMVRKVPWALPWFTNPVHSRSECVMPLVVGGSRGTISRGRF